MTSVEYARQTCTDVHMYLYLCLCLYLPLHGSHVFFFCTTITFESELVITLLRYYGLPHVRCRSHIQVLRIPLFLDQCRVPKTEFSKRNPIRNYRSKHAIVLTMWSFRKEQQSSADKQVTNEDVVDEAKGDEEGDDEKNPSSTGQQPTTAEESSESFNLGRLESTLINYTKILVVLVIIVVTTTMAIVTYSLVRKQEDDEYHAAVSKSPSHCARADTRIKNTD